MESAHAMAAAVNGMALSNCGRWRVLLHISDYARPAIRLAQLMRLPSLFVFTHDAMGDGEDGPTINPSSTCHRYEQYRA